jgi:large subunit ribosomal protein L24
MKLHTGDEVVVISGKEKGKTGRILRVLPGKQRVVVTRINLRTRHLRKTPQGPGRIVRYEASLHVSKVMLLDPKTRKRSRVGYRFGKDDRKERYAKRSKEALVSGRTLRRLVEEEVKEKKGEDSVSPPPPTSSLTPHP